MSKYSKLSQLMHKQFLGEGEITNLCLERIYNKSKSFNLNSCKNIFITGLARAGTTAILNYIDSTNEFGSLRYKYMPFILAPRIADFYSEYLVNKNTIEIERLHGDGLMISAQAAECLDEPFWIHSNKEKFNHSCLSPYEISVKDVTGYAYLLNRFLKIEGKKRLVIKNNNNHLRILSLASYLPNSIFLIIFRSPLAHAKSLLKLHKRLLKSQREDKFILDYMELIGHWEFGFGKKKFIYNESHELILNSLDDLKIEYWIKQWLLTYEWILRIFSKKDKKINNIKLVCYEDLFKDENYKSIFFDYLSINKSKLNFSFKLGKSNLESYPISNEDFELEKCNIIYEELRQLSKLNLNK